MVGTTCLQCGGLAGTSSVINGLKGCSVSDAFSQPSRRFVVVGAAGKGKENGKEEKKVEKKSIFTSVTDALDFAQVRSDADAELLCDARQATKSGEKMNPEQYAALRRKIGGTYRDFFKDSVDVDGVYTDDGWVDKTCRFCKKDTGGSPRTVDKLGRYAHVACAENPPPSNFFTRLFGR